MHRLALPQGRLLEGPTWDEINGRLSWVDVLDRVISSSTPDGGHYSREKLTGGEPASFVLRAGGGRLVGYRHRLALIDADGVERQVIALPSFDADRESFNDAAVDSRGRLWIGTMDPEVKSPTGALYRVDPDLTAHRMAEGLILSNGIAWSPDERHLYMCDSGARAVYVHDFDIGQGTVDNRRIFARFGETDGSPDGCAMDAEGCLWVAAVMAGQVIRFAPDGGIDRRVTTPAQWPTSVAFGGDALETLFITTMLPLFGTPATDDDAALYAVEPGVQGLPIHRFGG